MVIINDVWEIRTDQWAYIGLLFGDRVAVNKVDGWQVWVEQARTGRIHALPLQSFGVDLRIEDRG